MGAHLRKQLSFDLWYIFLGLFIITISEGSRIQDTKDYVSITNLCSRCAYTDKFQAFTTFAILFEVVSA